MSKLPSKSSSWLERYQRRNSFYKKVKLEGLDYCYAASTNTFHVYVPGQTLKSVTFSEELINNINGEELDDLLLEAKVLLLF
jgi:hypothetical protein